MWFGLGNPVGALYLFDHLPERNVPSWNTAISGCVRLGLFAKAVDLFRQMRGEGILPDGFVLASLLTAFNRWRNMSGRGIEIHSLALRLGLTRDVYVATSLLHLYGGCGMVFDARRLFEEMDDRNVVSWTALMVCFSANGYPREALSAYQKMRREEGVVCNPNSFATVISSCGLLGEEKLSLQIVGHALVWGFETDVSVANALITLFGNLGRTGDAETIFHRMTKRDIISWNSMITLYSHKESCEESLKLFSEMRHHGLLPDATTLSSLISACACLEHLEWGRGVHALSITDGLELFASVSNTLINMYSMSGKHEEAELLFRHMQQRDLISWNTMIAAYTQSGFYYDALRLLSHLLENNKERNHVTFATSVAACSGPEFLHIGKIIHTIIIHHGLRENLVVGNALITMYSNCKAMREAQWVFHTMPSCDVITCNTLIGGHVENEEQLEAMHVFTWMREAGVEVNYITVVNILAAFSNPHDLKYGKPLHAYTVSTGLECEVYVKNSLLTMYAKCGDLDSSVYIFDGLKIKTAVSWNAMIASKAHNGQGEDALKLFMEMRHVGIELDQFSLSGGLAASASLASVEEGQQIHALVNKLGFESDLHVINATMDMYGKCGKMDDVLKTHPEPMKRSQQSWNILISAYARHGQFEKAEDTFREMLAMGRKPDYVTFVSLLSACNHAGLVDNGLAYFESMNVGFGISPGLEHCVCMVDLLGRSGKLTEAVQFIEDMNIFPNDVIWRSLLSSSRIHRNLDVGRKAAMRLLELDPLDDSAYVLLSNVCAVNGKWEDVDRLRKKMESINLKKRPACSWIKIKNQVSTFGIGDKTHPQANQIYAKLEEMLQMIKKLGYVADTSFVLHDTDEEQKEQNLWSHSEKLALAYGLMNLPRESTITVFKNLRVCGDCHLVYKLVSRALNQYIVLRDPYRFHHFANGVCSCSDYW